MPTGTSTGRGGMPHQPDWRPTWSQAMNPVPTPGREARTPPRRQLRVTRRQHPSRMPSTVDRRSPSGRFLPY